MLFAFFTVQKTLLLFIIQQPDGEFFTENTFDRSSIAGFFWPTIGQLALFFLSLSLFSCCVVHSRALISPNQTIQQNNKIPFVIDEFVSLGGKHTN